MTQEPFVFPSLGPTAFLVFFGALSVQAAPRNVFFGHLIGVIAGVIALLIFGLYGVAPDLESVSLARIGARTVCVALTLSLMIWTGTPHAPAGATTLIVGLGLLQTPSQLATLMGAVVLMALLAIVINRLAGLPYPLWSFKPTENASGAVRVMTYRYPTPASSIPVGPVPTKAGCRERGATQADGEPCLPAPAANLEAPCSAPAASDCWP